MTRAPVQRPAENDPLTRYSCTTLLRFYGTRVSRTLQYSLSHASSAAARAPAHIRTHTQDRSPCAMAMRHGVSLWSQRCSSLNVCDGGSVCPLSMVSTLFRWTGFAVRGMRCVPHRHTTHPIPTCTTRRHPSSQLARSPTIRPSRARTAGRDVHAHFHDADLANSARPQSMWMRSRHVTERALAESLP